MVLIAKKGKGCEVMVIIAVMLATVILIYGSVRRPISLALELFYNSSHIFFVIQSIPPTFALPK
jgi:hypothetical protein